MSRSDMRPMSAAGTRRRNERFFQLGKSIVTKRIVIGCVCVLASCAVSAAPRVLAVYRPTTLKEGLECEDKFRALSGFLDSRKAEDRAIEDELAHAAGIDQLVEEKDVPTDCVRVKVGGEIFIDGISFGVPVLPAPDGHEVAYSVHCSVHPEFPGARGSVESTADGWKMLCDFTGGGEDVGLVGTPTPSAGIWAKSWSVEVLHDTRYWLYFKLFDSTGQVFMKYPKQSSMPGKWTRFTCDLNSGWYLHGGGANDGVFHYPITKFEICTHRLPKDDAAKGQTETLIRNMRFDTMTPQERAVATGDVPTVRYTVTDFTPGDAFSGGPRRFYRADDGMAPENGAFELDFSKRDTFTLVKDIPFWCTPEELLLTVDAEADAAGLEFEINAFAGHPYSKSTFGPLPKARPNAPRIRRTLTVGGFFDDTWKAAYGVGDKPPTVLNDNQRMTKLHVRRGTAPKRKLSVRLVRLEASVVAGEKTPPLLVMPPQSDEPPREVEAGWLNLCAGNFTNGIVDLRMKDWEGNLLGTAYAPLGTLRPGERGWVKIPLPPHGKGLNFVSYECTLMRSGRRMEGVDVAETSWVRPVDAPSSVEPRPDLIWGQGVYLHRNVDWLSYHSCYGWDLFDDEHGFRRSEQRAAAAWMAGIRWERTEFHPDTVNPRDGVWNFAFNDRLLDIAEKYGIKTFAVYSHFWPGGTEPYSKEAYRRYAETLGKCVARYRGRIDGWEIWNEPDCILFWQKSPEDYVRLVNLCYDELKKADPEAKLIACVTAGTNLEFIDRCYRAGMKCDTISVHPYEGDDERDFIGSLQALTNRTHGAKVYISEIGWSTAREKRGKTECEQAFRYVRAYLSAAASGCVRSINGYNLIDDGFNPFEIEDNFGVLRRDLTPKPAYKALAFVCRFFTQGAPSMDFVKFPSGGEACVFRMGGRSAVWTHAPHRVQIRTERAAVFYDMMGETLARDVSSAEVSVGGCRAVFVDGDVKSVEYVGGTARPKGSAVLDQTF